MTLRHKNTLRQDRPNSRNWCRILIVSVGFCAGLFAINMMTAHDCHAGTIPAWLDDAITEWSEENPAVPFQFVDIKDDFVWYMIPDTPETGHKEIRASIYEIVQANGYKLTSKEELVTTGKPPSPNAPYKEKKCWTRTFVLDIEELSNTKATNGRGGGERPGMRQRVLTSLVCDDRPYWFTGFRILQ